MAEPQNTRPSTGHVYISSSIYAHPAILSVPGSSVVVWLRSLCWMNANSRDGSVPRDYVRDSLRELGTNVSAVKHLVRAGLFVEDGDRFTMPKKAGISGIDLWKMGPYKAPRPAIPDDVRALVYERDGNACRHCGTGENLSIDHVIPWSKGGAHDESNFQTLCRPCNSAKGARV